MKHKTTATLGSITTLVMLGAAVSLGQATTAHADHDTGIYIETGKGNFTYHSDAAEDAIRECYRIDIKGTTANGQTTEINAPTNNDRNKYKPELEQINGVLMYTQTETCNNNRVDYNNITPLNWPKTQKEINELLTITSQQENLECLCKYWNTNTIKHEYTYTITDMPKDREIPPDYNDMVRAGIEAGLNSWAKINDINFTYTDNRLAADIVIQQQIGDGKQYGNAIMGCLLEYDQCTIQLFPDINIDGEQTLVNKNSIAWTIAHEFGHLIGLPHNTDPDHIMTTGHANNVRTYYEARNINVVEAPEQTTLQRLLAYEDIEYTNVTYIETETLDYTNVTQLMEHPITINFIKFVKAIIVNAGFETAAEYITKIQAELTN